MDKHPKAFVRYSPDVVSCLCDTALTKDDARQDQWLAVKPVTDCRVWIARAYMTYVVRCLLTSRDVTEASSSRHEVMSNAELGSFSVVIPATSAFSSWHSNSTEYSSCMQSIVPTLPLQSLIHAVIVILNVADKRSLDLCRRDCWWNCSTQGLSILYTNAVPCLILGLCLV